MLEQHSNYRGKSLKRKIREAQSIARDLGYSEKRIQNFVKARSEIELENMLISARKALI